MGKGRRGLRGVSFVKALLAFLLLGVISFAQADDWDNVDKGMFSAAITSTVIDWGQTRYIVKHPTEFHELNPLLGEHPRMGKVNTYFAGALLGEWAASEYLDGDKRKFFLTGVLLLEVPTIIRNRRIGIRFSF